MLNKSNQHVFAAECNTFACPVRSRVGAIFCAHMHATRVAMRVINKDMPMAGTRLGSGMCL